MNGSKDGAFRRALVDAVLEDYSDLEEAPLRRGAGSGRSGIRRAILVAALLMLLCVGTLAYGISRPEPVPEPTYEVEVLYTNPNAGKEFVRWKEEIETVYCPTYLPDGFIDVDEIIRKDEVIWCWGDQNSSARIDFWQIPLANTRMPSGETYFSSGERVEIETEVKEINGFPVYIIPGQYEVDYYWNDGEYYFHLSFYGDSITEQERYAVFNSIAVMDVEHYVNENAGKDVQPKGILETFYLPTLIPERFEITLSRRADTFLYCQWESEFPHEEIRFYQRALKDFSYGKPDETADYFWQEDVISGFSVTISYLDEGRLYEWDDGAYYFRLLTPYSFGEEELFYFFDSIRAIENIEEAIKANGA